MKDVSIQLVNINKRYTIHHEKPTLIGSVFAKKVREPFWALRNINLTIKKGEKIGIIGPNGAGKTTLLKIIAGITTPTSGKVETAGRVVSLIDLEAGFSQDLTGEENIVLNGMLMGLTKEEIEKKMSRITAFADIHRFIDSPFYSYSAGMKFRLAFSIAKESECDILLMDEIVGAADAEYRKKVVVTIKDIQKRKGITTVICSHIPLFVWGYATKFFELNHGRLRQISSKDMLSAVATEHKTWQDAFPVLRKITSGDSL